MMLYLLYFHIRVYPLCTFLSISIKSFLGKTISAAVLNLHFCLLNFYGEIVHEIGCALLGLKTTEQ